MLKRDFINSSRFNIFLVSHQTNSSDLKLSRAFTSLPTTPLSFREIWDPFINNVWYSIKWNLLKNSHHVRLPSTFFLLLVENCFPLLRCSRVRFRTFFLSFLDFLPCCIWVHITYDRGGYKRSNWIAIVLLFQMEWEISGKYSFWYIQFWYGPPVTLIFFHEIDYCWIW